MPHWANLPPPTRPAPPLWATNPTAGRMTFGPMVMQTMRALGWSPMPWQSQVANVALEIDPLTGEWFYPTVVVIVQRQAGKTSLVDSMGVHRAVTGEDRGIWYTAQSRQDARDEWLKLVKRIRRSPLAALVKIRESNGSETITFPTGSEYRPFAPSEDALHGKATHLVTVDEGWAFPEERGDELLQAIVPTFTTVPGQLFIPSAAGNQKSTWLQGLADTGRLFVEQDRRDTFAYFEWGIPPDVDAADLGAIALHHPGYGYTLRPQALVNAAATMKPGEFVRAYGSRWGSAASRAIPGPLWETGRDAATELPAGRGMFALAFDVALGDADAAVCLAWRDQLGRAHVEIADVEDGAAWLVGRLAELVAEHGPLAVQYDRFGPAAVAADAATRAGLVVVGTTTDEYLTACASFLSGLVAGTIKVRAHPALDAAAAAAVKRPVGDRWAWGRRAASSTIAPLVAATLAVWAFDHAPPPPQPFRVM